MNRNSANVFMPSPLQNLAIGLNQNLFNVDKGTDIEQTD